MNSFICTDCGHKIADFELLTAPNPFNPEETICGCPKCRCAGAFPGACDEPECKNVSGMGTPTPNGYRRTCYKHKPEDA